MHNEVMEFLQRVANRDAGFVIELGSRDVNGSPRALFAKARRYLGVDIMPGPGVDFVCDAASFESEEKADVVVCVEVLEHAPNWPAIVRAAALACKPGGQVLITCAGPDRPPHSAIVAGPLQEGEYYGNINPNELADVCALVGLHADVECDGQDVRVNATKGTAANVGGLRVAHGGDVVAPSTTFNDAIESALARPPLLSLCIIVKNGERTLPKLFASLVGHGFDEVVVVDTGSTDKTREIVARTVEGPSAKDMAWFSFAMPAGEGEVMAECAVPENEIAPRWVLAHFGWCDDFAAARNFSYACARGKWRMYLDADDFLEFRGKLPPGVPPGTKPRLADIVRRVDARGTRNAIFLPYAYKDGFSSQDVMRIVRWNDGWEWKDAIHEHLAAKYGRRQITKIDDLFVVHNKTEAEEAASWERNARIIAAMKESADDATYGRVLFHEAAEHRKFGHLADADRAMQFVEATMEHTTFWLSARQARIQMAALDRDPPDLDAALELAGGLWGHIPDIKDGPLYVGFVYTLRRDFYRAAYAFDQAAVSGDLPARTLEDDWMTHGVFPAARALAYAHLGRFDDARKAIAQVTPALERELAVRDLLLEARREVFKGTARKALNELIDTLLADSQPFEALAALANAPACIRDEAFVSERRRAIHERVSHVHSDDAYFDAYAPKSEKDKKDYHGDAYDVLDTERARAFLEWVDALEKSGPPVAVLVIGSHECVIEDAALARNERIEVVLVDACPEANTAAERLQRRFPGRVRMHKMRNSVYDWAKDEGPYDAITCFEVIEHVPSDDDAFLALTKPGMLKPEGWLFLSTPCADRWNQVELAARHPPPPRYWHVRAYSAVSLWHKVQTHGLTGSIIEGADGTLVFAGQHEKREPGRVHGVLTPAVMDYPLSVEIFVPNTPNPFDAVSPEVGFLGGSEEAVVRLSRALAAQGHMVTVYAPEKRRDGARIHVQDGVVYRPLDHFDPGKKRPRDACVLFWRCPQILAAYAQAYEMAYHKYLWLHDALYRARPEEYAKASRVLVLSDHHRRCVVKHDGAEGATLTRFPNGIDVDDFGPIPDDDARSPTSVIFASSPERGLDTLLNVWSKVREAVPTATLDIFYDWKGARKYNPHRIERLERLLVELADKGVRYHGGVAQPELHAAFRRAAVWAYPNVGDVETFCITALKAQAAGCAPVVTDAGALPEVVLARPLVPQEDIIDNGGARFADALIDVLKHPLEPADRRRLRAHALRFTWEEVANRLVDLITWDTTNPNGARDGRGPDDVEAELTEPVVTHGLPRMAKEAKRVEP